jgi:hypothetical protein
MARIVIPRTIWSGLGPGAVTAKTKDSCRLDRLVRVDGALKNFPEINFRRSYDFASHGTVHPDHPDRPDQDRESLEFFGPGGPRKAVLVRAPTCVNRSSRQSLTVPRLLA